MIAMRMLMLLMVMWRKHIHVVVRHGVLLVLLVMMLLLILHRCPRSSVRRDIHVEVVSCCIIVCEVAHEPEEQETFCQQGMFKG